MSKSVKKPGNDHGEALCKFK